MWSEILWNVSPGQNARPLATLFQLQEFVPPGVYSLGGWETRQECMPPPSQRYFARSIKIICSRWREIAHSHTLTFQSPIAPSSFTIWVAVRLSSQEPITPRHYLAWFGENLPSTYHVRTPRATHCIMILKWACHWVHTVVLWPFNKNQSTSRNEYMLHTREEARTCSAPIYCLSLASHGCYIKSHIQKTVVYLQNNVAFYYAILHWTPPFINFRLTRFVRLIKLPLFPLTRSPIECGKRDDTLPIFEHEAVIQ